MADDKTLKRLCALAASLNSGEMDDEVHDLKDGEAADINNGGVDAQVKYLLQMLGEEKAEELINELLEENK